MNKNITPKLDDYELKNKALRLVLKAAKIPRQAQSHMAEEKAIYK